MNHKTIVSPNKIGPYLLRETIGHGSYSIVRKAVNILNDHEFACKIVSKRIMDRSERKALLQCEVDILYELNRKGFVGLCDLLEDSINFYIFCNYCSGGTLYSKISREGKLNEDKAKLLFKQNVDSLAEFHDMGFIHRDIKAENIFLDDKGGAHLGDFGFSIKIKSDTSLHAYRCYSAGYSPPEVFENKLFDGKKGDLWSLGVVLYYIVSGKLPFGHDDKNDHFHELYDKEPVFPSDLSNDCVDLIKSLLKVDPRQRIDIDRVKEHPWLSDTTEDMRTPVDENMYYRSRNSVRNLFPDLSNTVSNCRRMFVGKDVMSCINFKQFLNFKKMPTRNSLDLGELKL